MSEVTKEQTGKKQIGVKLALLLVCLIVVIAASIVFIGCNNPNAEERAGEEIEITIIQSEYEYDGEKHWIEVSGVKEGDEVRYSTDGEKWESARPEYSEPGEYEIYIRIDRRNSAAYIKQVTLVISRKSITGVFIRDITIIAGREIKPNKEGTEETDEIKYSVNNGEYKDRIEIIEEPGKYTVKYEIIREGEGKQNGEFTVTVLPDVSGTYVGNGEKVILTETTMTTENSKSTIEYGIDGKGKTDSNETFQVSKDKLIMNNKTYDKQQENETIKELRINGKKYYVKSKDISRIEIKIKDNTAIVTVNNEKIAEIEEVNYVENIIGGEKIEREYITNTVTIKIITDITEIELTKREKEEPKEITTTRLYDGTMHGIEIETEYENVMYYENGEYKTEQTQYKEIGEYEYTVIVMREGYVPSIIEGKLIILPDMSGIYIADNDVLEIDKYKAKLNNEEVEYEHGIEGGKINGQTAKYGNGKIELNGKEYVKTNEKILVIEINNERCVITRSGEYMELRAELHGSVTRVSVTDKDTDEILGEWETSGTITTVTLDGKALPGIPDCTGMTYYICESDLVHSVGWIEVKG